MTEITDADRKAAAAFKDSVFVHPDILARAFAAHRLQEREALFAALADPSCHAVECGTNATNCVAFAIECIACSEQVWSAMLKAMREELCPDIASGAHDQG